MESESTKSELSSGGLGTHAPGIRVWRSEELFGRGREIVIEHDRNHYRLRITKPGKLILNK